MFTTKVSPEGILHPLQLHIDKIQFFTDKLFEEAEKPKPNNDVAVLLMAEIVSLFINLLASLVVTYNLKKPKEGVDEILNGVDEILNFVKKQVFRIIEEEYIKKKVTNGKGSIL